MGFAAGKLGVPGFPLTHCPGPGYGQSAASLLRPSAPLRPPPRREPAPPRGCQLGRVLRARANQAHGRRVQVPWERRRRRAGGMGGHGCHGWHLPKTGPAQGSGWIVWRAADVRFDAVKGSACRLVRCGTRSSTARQVFLQQPRTARHTRLASMDRLLGTAPGQRGQRHAVTRAP